MELMKNIELDAKMLRDKNIMDYSLLLAIEKNPDFKDVNGTMKSSNSEFLTDDISPELRRKHECLPYKWVSHGGRYIYHISIIDYLQDYNFDKKAENFYKTIKNKKGAEISAIEPFAYCTRYIDFMRSSVLINQKRGATIA